MVDGEEYEAILSDITTGRSAHRLDGSLLNEVYF